MSIAAFKHIGNAFEVGNVGHKGMVIASPTDLYLITTRVLPSATQLVVGALGGAIGGAIYGAITAAASRTSPQKGTVLDLDIRIRTHPEWPYTRIDADETNQVIVLPRGAVRVVNHRSFSNLLQFDLGSTPIVIYYLLFRGAAIRDYLLAAGWDLDWCGKRLKGETESYHVEKRRELNET